MRNIDKYFDKLRCIINSNIGKDDELVLKACETLANLSYTYNQWYVDDWLEGIVKKFARKEDLDASRESKPAQNSVLFYDGFGLDNRGLVQIYLKALTGLNYKIVYITVGKKNAQPQVLSLLNENASIYYLNDGSSTKRLKALRSILSIQNFIAAFFYSTPFDIVGAIGFSELSGKCNRFLINLTDHAFWIGRDSVDYSIEFRDYGASISHFKRGFAIDQLVELPYYPIVNRDVPFGGFPEKCQQKKVIFSGGSLYKTIDEHGTFYKIVETIVSRHPDVAFLYAGYGDDRYIKNLVKKYPTQVVHIAERKDLYEVLRHSYIYLNTYPISGALMLQYAAKAGCIPVSLVRAWDGDATGILLHEDILHTSFTEQGELIAEIEHLLEDESYKCQKSKLLESMVIKDEDFTNRLDDIIKNPSSPYVTRQLDDCDTTLFLEGYKKNFTYNVLVKSLINLHNMRLWIYFPKEVLYRIIRVFYEFLRTI